MAYCLYDGKVDQGSEFETSLYQSLFYQLKEMQECFIFISCNPLVKMLQLLNQTAQENESCKGYSTNSLGLDLDVSTGFGKAWRAFVQFGQYLKIYVKIIRYTTHIGLLNKLYSSKSGTSPGKISKMQSLQFC